MNPYECRPDHIPDTDAYADIPYYGRYWPRPNDFQIDRQYIMSQSAPSLAYWQSVIALCDESSMIYPADEDGRDVFAVGAIIVKSSHLHHTTRDGQSTIDFSFADANELEATNICRKVLNSVRVPEIYFVGKIDGRQTIIQERLPGVCLNVAAPYLSTDQKESFKTQARAIIRQMCGIKPSDGRRDRSHVVRDPNILTNGRLGSVEGNILFTPCDADPDLSLMHNDFTPSNCIVSDDKITGLVDWEMAGFIGLRTAGEVHRMVRSPRKEHFVNANLSEDQLQGILWWNDLYDEGSI